MAASFTFHVAASMLADLVRLQSSLCYLYKEKTADRTFSRRQTQHLPGRNTHLIGETSSMRFPS